MMFNSFKITSKKHLLENIKKEEFRDGKKIKRWINPKWNIAHNAINFLLLTKHTSVI